MSDATILRSLARLERGTWVAELRRRTGPVLFGRSWFYKAIDRLEYAGLVEDDYVLRNGRRHRWIRITSKGRKAARRG